MISLEVFSFGKRAERQRIYRVSTECEDTDCLDIAELKKVMRFLCPRMSGITLDII